MASVGLAGSSVVPSISTEQISKISLGGNRVSFFHRNGFQADQLQRSVNDLQGGGYRVSLAVKAAQITSYEQPSVKKEAPVAIVTEASRGFGKAIALMFGKAGCKVLVNCSRSSKEAEEVSQQIVALGGQALTFGGDVSVGENVASSMIKTAVDAWGAVDVLVNCAGVTRNFLSMSMMGLQRPEIVDLSFPALSRCTEEAISVMMKKGHGRIINIASVVNLGGAVARRYYCAADGVIDYSKELAKVHYDKGIDVNVIAPHFMVSDMTTDQELGFPPQYIVSDQELDFAVKILEKIQLGRYSQFESAASLVKFLALGPESCRITNQVFYLDEEMVM